MWKQTVDWFVYKFIDIPPNSKLGSSLNFFIYDTIKILFMLALIIFLVAIIRSYFPPEKTKKILSHKKEFIGNIIAALLGIVTPFCSCSAVPVFIGFIEAGVPLGVTFSFLISSPMVNEVALILIWQMFGWKIAAIYIATGVIVAIISGILIGKLELEKEVEEYVYQIKSFQNGIEIETTWRDRIDYAKSYVYEIIIQRKIWIYVMIGIGIGAIIHGYAPQDFLAKYAGKDNPIAVPIAVLIGVPLYSNAAGIIPIAHALMEKGMAMGTVLAFMMSVTALSLPEMIILRKVLKPKLIAIFVGILSVAIVGVGYLFNIII